MVLSRRERQVLRLVCLGFTNAEIARQLGNSEPTICKRISTLMAAVGAVNRVQLVLWAVTHPECFGGCAAPVGLHPRRCFCGNAHCTAMRIADAFLDQVA